MIGHHRLGAAVQVARPAVITQAAPQGQDLALLGRGQGLDVGKSVQESRVVIEYGADLGLLQHHLGQPHTVGVARALPRQAVATLEPLPVDQARGKTQGFWHWGQ